MIYITVYNIQMNKTQTFNLFRNSTYDDSSDISTHRAKNALSQKYRTLTHSTS